MRRGVLWLFVCAGCPGAPARVAHPTAPAADAGAPLEVIHLPTGADITPRAAPGSILVELDPRVPGHPEMRAAYAMSLALSPDGATLALLTSGYNTLEDKQGDPIAGTHDEHVFFFDLRGAAPVLTQTVALPNTFVGLAFAPAGDRLYVSGGADDVLQILARDSGRWAPLAPVSLGHAQGLGIKESPLAAGLAAGDGFVAVANRENDSLTLVDARSGALREVELRPGHGVPGGAFPLAVTVAAGRVYVVAERDREVVEVDPVAGRVLRRLAVGGPPVGMVASADGAHLYVTGANSDDLIVVERERFAVSARIALGGPPGTRAATLRGANPNGLVLAADGKSAFVSLGGSNSVALVNLRTNTLEGLVPTGFYPNAVALSRDGKTLFCAYGKSQVGPTDGTQSPLALMRGGLHVLPVPDAHTLAGLTAQALANEHTEAPPAVPPVFEALRGKVRHVVYVIGENRTFDQILGDVRGLDGDARLVHWGAALTPNQHALAATFSGFDRFFDSGGVSGDGWQWTTAARTTDMAEREVPQLYASRGHHSYDWEGRNRNIPVSYPTVAERKKVDPRVPDDPDLLPGTADVGAVDRPPDGPGYLWDLAKAHGVTVRNYGFFIADEGGPAGVREPAKAHTQVAFTTALGLVGQTDPYFRGFDMAYPDFWRMREWLRELADFERAGEMPGLELVRLPHDHMGSFAKAIDGVDTPDTQVADHDHALGTLVAALSKTRFWESTVVVMLEDDAQDGPDHIDAHRSILFFAGGHAARGVVSHTVHNTPDVLRTVELLLGLPPLARRDAVATPIAEALQIEADNTAFEAVVPEVLRSTKLPLLPPGLTEHAVQPRGTAAFWAQATAAMRFDHADEVDSRAFNALLEKELTRREP